MMAHRSLSHQSGRAYSLTTAATGAPNVRLHSAPEQIPNQLSRLVPRHTVGPTNQPSGQSMRPCMRPATPARWHCTARARGGHMASQNGNPQSIATVQAHAVTPSASERYARVDRARLRSRAAAHERASASRSFPGAQVRHAQLRACMHMAPEPFQFHKDTYPHITVSIHPVPTLCPHLHPPAAAPAAGWTEPA